MSNLMRLLTFIFLLGVWIRADLIALEVSPSDRALIFSRISPRDTEKLTAFSELFPRTFEGDKALYQAVRFLLGNQVQLGPDFLDLIKDAPGMINLTQVREKNALEAARLNQRFQVFNPWFAKLANRNLQGFYATTLDEVLQLPDKSVDLGRALLLAELEEGPDKLTLLTYYEALFDAMAQQIKARLEPGATPLDIVNTMNQMIFFEWGFRFPPQSLYKEEIDLYTFLPSVVDSKRGVCLGVSMLYLVLGDRLGLSLEIITPPGHIYVRLPLNNGHRNIETTARGIDLPDEAYEGLFEKPFKPRARKEVIGMAFVNQASLYLTNEKYQEARKLYEKAMGFMPNDPLVQELLAYTLILDGQESTGLKLLQKAFLDTPLDEREDKQLLQDLLAGRADGSCIKAYLTPVDHTRESFEKRIASLNEVLQNWPEFHDGWVAKGTAELQLSQTRAALESLKTASRLTTVDPVVHFLLAQLYLDSLVMKSAFWHTQALEKIALTYGPLPKSVRKLKLELDKQAYFYD